MDERFDFLAQRGCFRFLAKQQRVQLIRHLTYEAMVGFARQTLQLAGEELQLGGLARLPAIVDAAAVAPELAEQVLQPVQNR